LISKLKIRSATSTDVSKIFELIQALAEYEKLTHMVSGNSHALKEHLFGERPCAEAILADWEADTVGFALFFTNYSTFLTQPGIYLEDLFVLPTYRRRGIGKAMLAYLAELALKRGAGRLEWSVLDWNQSAIAFYQNMGAAVLPDWRICRVTGDNLPLLATRSEDGSFS
jgi:GNAT superfamily N-acetyltransferase